MSRFRLYPTPAQEALLLEHCAHARFVWNLGLELTTWGRLETYGTATRRTRRDGTEYIHQKRRPVVRPPGFAAQCRQLTEARAAEPWLAAGSVTVQVQALRDLDQAWRNFFAGTHRRPTWRKAGLHEGFRVVGQEALAVRHDSRKWSSARIPKIGWVRFRRSRAMPEWRSYRVTRDRSGRWHIAFAAVPEPVPAPGNAEVVGIDRGVKVAAALSTGERESPAGLRPKEAERLVRLQRKAARRRVRGRPASSRLKRTYRSIARLRGREADRRKDWAEKLSTDLARRFDVIRVEDLKIRNMTCSARGTLAKPGKNVRQKAGLNREIARSGWGLLVSRLEQKAPGRVEKVNPAYTSQTCSACGHCAPENRKSQAVFCCVACGFQANADVNAAMNIASGRPAGGRPVAARGDRVKSARSVKREPQTAASAA